MNELVKKCQKALSEAESACADIAEALPLMRGRLDAILPIIIPIISEEIKRGLEEAMGNLPIETMLDKDWQAFWEKWVK